VLVAHGFSDHIWGRIAGLLAACRTSRTSSTTRASAYTAWRRLQTRWLARRTDLIVGVSEGVRQSLLALGMPADRTISIPNGTRLERFSGALAHPFERREPGILMCARFAGQKDHATLLRAIALLRKTGLRPRCCWPAAATRATSGGREACARSSGSTTRSSSSATGPTCPRS